MKFFREGQRVWRGLWVICVRDGWTSSISQYISTSVSISVHQSVYRYISQYIGTSVCISVHQCVYPGHQAGVWGWLFSPLLSIALHSFCNTLWGQICNVERCFGPGELLVFPVVLLLSCRHGHVMAASDGSGLAPGWGSGGSWWLPAPLLWRPAVKPMHVGNCDVNYNPRRNQCLALVALAPGFTALATLGWSPTTDVSVET